MLPSISVTEVKPPIHPQGERQGEPQGVIIDVRSESEYTDAHVPGALNIPLLNDAERAEVGTLYKREGAHLARLRGLEIVRPKMGSLFEQIAKASRLELGEVVKPSEEQWDEVFRLVSHEILEMNFEDGSVGVERSTSAAPLRDTSGTSRRADSDSTSLRQPAHRPITFYCWRGGARSKSMTLFAQALGFDCQYIVGGHKAFRNEVLKFLNGDTYPFQLCTLYGLTGSGKTDIIRQWLKEGKPVIDLEALAHHRGSAFGQVGIEIRGRQKDFENNLYWEMQKLLLRQEKMVVVEGESRRIGFVQLPENFMKGMLEGKRVRVVVSLQERVQNILREYVRDTDEAKMVAEARRALEAIQRRLGGEKFKEFSDLLNKKDYATFTEQLLIHYYDKTYQHARETDAFYHCEISNAQDWKKLGVN